jgi:hypothetical protein
MSLKAVFTKKVLMYVIATLVALWLLLAVIAFAAGRWVEPRLDRAIDAAFEVEVTTGDLGVRLFPRGYLQIADVLIPDLAGDTLLSAEMLSLRVKIWPLFRGRIEIPAVGLSGGRVNVHEVDGRMNYEGVMTERTPGEEEDGGPDFHIDKVVVERVRVDYRSGGVHLRSEVDGGRVDWVEDEGGWMFFPEVYLRNTRIKDKDGDVALDPMIVEGEVAMAGDFASWQARPLLVEMAGMRLESRARGEREGGGWHVREGGAELEADLAQLERRAGRWLAGVVSEASGEASAAFTGTYYRPGQAPRIEGSWALEKADGRMGSLPGRFDRVRGRGLLVVTGSGGRGPTRVRVEVEELDGRYDKGPWAVHGTVDYGEVLHARGGLKAELSGASLGELGIFHGKKGQLDIDLNSVEWRGGLVAWEGQASARKLDLDAYGKTFRLTGDLRLRGDSVAFDDMDLEAGDDQLTCRGSVRYAGGKVPWRYLLDGDVETLDLNAWLAWYSEAFDGEAEAEESSQEPFTGTSRWEIGKLYYKRGVFRDSRMELQHLPGEWLADFSGEAFSGNYEAQLQWPDVGSGRLDVRWEDLRLDEGMAAMENFGQDYITHRKLEGVADGFGRFVFEKDDGAVTRTTADLAFTIADGRLLDVELMEYFSSIAKLSELRNMRFEQLHAVLRYDGQRVLLPATRIESNVADLVISGQHGTDMSYIYDLRIDGSSVLARSYYKKHKAEGRGRDWLQLFYHVEGNLEDVDYRADKRVVNAALLSGENLREQIVARLRERYGPERLLINTATWRQIPEYNKEVEGEDVFLDFGQ